MQQSINPIIIYDLGANDGEDIPYYLQKADLVIAVEANPVLANNISDRHRADIEQDRLRVENVVLLDNGGEDVVPFHINTINHRMSRFPKPDDAMGYGSLPSHYRTVNLPSLSVQQLIERHGLPYYMKLDLEYYDAHILRALFDIGVFPPLISVESQDVEIFALLVAIGRYNSFKLIDGSQVGRDFANHPIRTSTGVSTFSFPHHAAGPFGDDLPGPWRDANSFFRHLALHGVGWKDLHASRIDPANSTEKQTLIDYIVEERVPGPVKPLARTVMGLANKLTRKSWPSWKTIDKS